MSAVDPNREQRDEWASDVAPSSRGHDDEAPKQHVLAPIIAIYAQGRIEEAFEYLEAKLQRAEATGDAEVLSTVPIVARPMTDHLKGRDRQRFEHLTYTADEVARERVPLDGRLEALMEAVEIDGDAESPREILTDELTIAAENDDEETLEAIHTALLRISRHLDAGERAAYDWLTRNTAETIESLRINRTLERIEAANDEFRRSGDVSRVADLLDAELSRADKTDDAQALESIASTVEAIAEQLYGEERARLARIASAAEDCLDEFEYEETYPTGGKPSVGLWGFVLLFGAFGGFIGWLALKNTDRERADHVLKWGFIWSGIGFATSTLFCLLLWLILLRAVA